MSNITMTEEQHRDRHKELHKSLDELVADWMTHTDLRPSTATVLDLMKWSAQQCERPSVK